MRVNPFSDTLSFLTTGGWTTVVLWLLLVASIGIAFFNCQRDPRQRSALQAWARFLLSKGISAQY